MKFALVRPPCVWNDAEMFLFFAAPLLVPQAPTVYQQIVQSPIPQPQKVAKVFRTAVPTVPFYSQFSDISSAKWKKVGCGITSLAMVIDFYSEPVPVDTLLDEGITAGAYLQSAGWTYKGLIHVSQKYGLDGVSYDLGKKSTDTAFAQFKKHLEDGPVIASVHYKFDPKSTIPHLVVIDGIENGVVYYNDPAAKTGGLTISTADFLKAWKKRYIVVRPVQKEKTVAYRSI